MRFYELPLPGVYRVEIEKHSDERGFFARTFCEGEFKSRQLVDRFSQASVSFNTRRGTVRGMHFSAEPHTEIKLVRCTLGAIYDVIIDLRPDSPTYLKTCAAELSASNRNALYVPRGCAHGFQTLRDDTEVLYFIDIPYVASASRGIRWNDPAVGISWPEPISIISERDLDFPDWKS